MNLGSAWWHGEDLRHCIILGLPLFAWARIGLLLGAVSTFVVVAELAGPDKLRVWGESLSQRSNMKRMLLFLLMGCYWFFFLAALLFVAGRDVLRGAYRRWKNRFGPVSLVENTRDRSRTLLTQWDFALKERLRTFFGESRRGVRRSSTNAFVILSLLIAVPMALGVTGAGWQHLFSPAGPGWTVSGLLELVALLAAFAWTALLGFVFVGSWIAGTVLCIAPLVGILVNVCLVRPLAWVLSRDTLRLLKTTSVFTLILSLLLTLLAA